MAQDNTKKPAAATATTEAPTKTETAAPVTVVATSETPVDPRINDLEAEVVTLKAQIDGLHTALKAADQKVIDTLRAAKHKTAPTNNVVHLDGKSWPIKRTVMAKFALDEVKKGHIPEDVTLVVIDKLE